MRYDLIDEYRLYIHPVVLGDGNPLFDRGQRPVRLSLRDARTFGNGVVLLRYVPSAASGAGERG
jgi:dihydrofolate reductase